MKAVEKEKLEIFKTLSAKDCIEINAQNRSNESILHIASKVRNEELIKEILKCEKINVNLRNAELETPLHLAIQYNNEFLFNCLINNEKTDINLKNNKNETPLMIILNMMELKVDKDSYKIHYSYYDRRKLNENLEKYALLLIENKSFHNNHKYFYLACKKRSLKIVISLISKEIDINKKIVLIFNFFVCCFNFFLIFYLCHGITYRCTK